MLEVGDRIELIVMPDDPAPIEPGTQGTVRRIQRLEWGKCTQIGVDWDNGRTLHLCVPPDRYRILDRRPIDG